VLTNYFFGSFIQIKPSTNTTSATFCNFWLHSQLVDILSPIIFTKIPCYYVLFNFLGEKIHIFGQFLSKNPIFSDFTFQKYHICNFLQLFSSQPVSRLIKYWNISKKFLATVYSNFCFWKNLDFWSFYDPKSHFYQL
jgi:hypothetical protein